MSSSFMPPRQVKIGDAASFVGITPRAIRHYYQISLLPEPKRSGDGRRRYGYDYDYNYDYDEMIRLLWIRKMAEAGIALDDIRDAFADMASAGADDHDVAGVLERLEETLTAREAELQRQRSAVQCMRTRGSRTGLLSAIVTDRLERLPEGSPRQADLDSLLVMEQIFGLFGAAVNATRFIALATHRGLREHSDRVEAAEEALDDTVAVDDPRVAQVAAERHAFVLVLQAVIEDSGLTDADEALYDSWDALHPYPIDEDEDEAGQGSFERPGSMSAVEAVGKMPYDFSPARVRCLELTVELAAHE